LLARTTHGPVGEWHEARGYPNVAKITEGRTPSPEQFQQIEALLGRKVTRDVAYEQGNPEEKQVTATFARILQAEQRGKPFYPAKYLALYTQMRAANPSDSQYDVLVRLES
jgi:hypothetical protein